MSIEVTSLQELKAAVENGATEIVSYDREVVKKLKAIKLAKSFGPLTVAGIIALIPLAITTGPITTGFVSAAVMPSAGIATSTIVALAVAIGGTIAISLFTDWEYIEIGLNGIKLKRKKT